MLEQKVANFFPKFVPKFVANNFQKSPDLVTLGSTNVYIVKRSVSRISTR